jgi:hypothetical protein
MRVKLYNRANTHNYYKKENFFTDCRRDKTDYDLPLYLFTKLLEIIDYISY